MTQDEKWMSEALQLAEKARGRTSPNPLVGAVVVKKGEIVGKGYHACLGGPHAEAVALQRAGARARGSTLYVTLEPCATWGRTPPCVDAVIASRLRRVIIGSTDPNPKNHRAGIAKLRKAGIETRWGILSDRAEKQNEAFFKRMQTGIPFITLKMAQSLDGKIAVRNGRSRWISSKASRAFVHRLRQEVDAILVGKNTALVDNPRLAGLNGSRRPWRVVLDTDLELKPSARLFRGGQLTLVAVSEKKLIRLTRISASRGCMFLPVPERASRLELQFLLRRLAELGVNHLLVEGGGELAWSLIEQGLVDRLIWIVAPKIIGGRESKTSVEGKGVRLPRMAVGVRWEKVYPLGPDWVFETCLQESSKTKRL